MNPPKILFDGSIETQSSSLDENCEVEDPPGSYDVYTKLAERIFKVPRSLVCFVDSHRNWLQSRFQSEKSSKPLSKSSKFNHLTKMLVGSSSDFIVVLDASTDKRFANMSIVTGPPFVRFFAAASIYISGIKIGALFLVDREPHRGFDLKSINKILDLAAMISTLLEEERKVIANMESELAQINMGVLYNLKYPLDVLNKRHQQLISNTKNARRCQEGEFKAALSTFRQAVDNMQMVLEICLRMAHRFIQTVNNTHVSSSSSEIISSSRCEIIPHLSHIYETVKCIGLQSELRWTIHNQHKLKGLKGHTHPDILMLVLLSTIYHLSTCWQRISVDITIHDPANAGEDVHVGLKDGYIMIVLQCAVRKQVDKQRDLEWESFDDIVLRPVVGMVKGQITISSSHSHSKVPPPPVGSTVPAAIIAAVKVVGNIRTSVAVNIRDVHDRYEIKFPCAVQLPAGYLYHSCETNDDCDMPFATETVISTRENSTERLT